MRYNVTIDDDAIEWYTTKSKVKERDLDLVIQQAIAAMMMIPSTKISVLKIIERRRDATK